MRAASPRSKRPRTVAALVGGALVGGALAVASCLPGDTRPEPGSLLVQVAPAAAITHGFVTDDGWTVTFDRLVLALGNVQLHGDACNGYSEANYDRLFDMAAATQAQKIGQVWGLGTCDVQFRMRNPSEDALLGDGATAADVESMRTCGEDPWVTLARVAVIARGVATRGAEVERFDWRFRQGFSVQDCTAGPTGDGGGEITLRGAEARTLSLEVRPEELFRIAADDSAPTRFDLFAAADVDSNGEITFDELTHVPEPVWVADAGAPDGGDAGDAGDAADSGGDSGGGSGGGGGAGGSGGGTEGAGGATLKQSLGGLLYNELVGRLVRVSGGGSCKSEVRGRGQQCR